MVPLAPASVVQAVPLADSPQAVPAQVPSAVDPVPSQVVAAVAPVASVPQPVPASRQAVVGAAVVSQAPAVAVPQAPVVPVPQVPQVPADAGVAAVAAASKTAVGDEVAADKNAQEVGVLDEPIDKATKLVIDLDEHLKKYLPAEDEIVTAVTIAPHIYSGSEVGEAEADRQNQMTTLIDQVNRLAESIEVSA